jgi:hypothetical protein
MSTSQEFQHGPQGPGHELCGVHGWLLFFVIVFFLNALNILSIPAAYSLIDWDRFLGGNETAITYHRIASAVEFCGAVVSLTAAILIINRRKAAVIAVNVYCLLMAGISVAGLMTVKSAIRLARDGVSAMGISQLTRYFSNVTNISWDRLIGVSLYSAYATIIALMLIIFLYFQLSQRVKLTLVR